MYGRPRLADHPPRGPGHGAGVRGLGDPGGELGVEIVEGGNAAGGEEGVAQVLDHPLDLALLVAAVRRAGLGREVIVPGQLEQARMEADVIADSLQDDALEIVVQEGPRHPAERGEGFDVAPQETLQRLIQGEARVHGARPREHKDEAGQYAPAAAAGKRAEVSPVDLGLLAGQRLQTQVGRGPRGGTDGPHVAADLDGRPGKAPLAQHGVQAGGAQAGVRLQGGGEERLVGIERTGAYLGPRPHEPVALDRVVHGVVVDAERGRDGADAPVLGIEEPADLGALLRRDHRQASAARRRARPVMGQRGVADEPATAPTARAAQWTGRSEHGRIRIGSLLAGALSRRRRSDDAGARGAVGSRMRHFLAPGAVARLAGGVMEAPAAAVLIAAAGRLPGGVPGAVRARPRAIASAAIAAPAEEEDLPTVRAGADHKPERVHAPPRPGHRGGQSRAAMRRRGAESRAPQCVIWPEGPGCADSGPSPFRPSRGTIYVTSSVPATAPSFSRTAGSDSRAFSRPSTLAASSRRSRCWPCRRRGAQPHRRVNVLSAYFLWPVLGVHRGTRNSTRTQSTESTSAPVAFGCPSTGPGISSSRTSPRCATRA